MIETSQLDLHLIPFPSDRLSLACLRKTYPEQFDAGLQPEAFDRDAAHKLGDILTDVLYSERLLARCAYAIRAGLEIDELDITDPAALLSLQKSLAQNYKALQITSGLQSAMHEIQSFMSRAAELAPGRANRR